MPFGLVVSVQIDEALILRYFDPFILQNQSQRTLALLVACSAYLVNMLSPWLLLSQVSLSHL